MPLNSKTFGGIMNIVVWLPFMTGYTAFSPKQEDKGLKGKGSVWFYHFPHPLHISLLQTYHCTHIICTKFPKES